MAGQSNRSEAYDLALFEPKQAKIVELTPNKKLQKAERRRTRVQSVLNTMGVLLVSTVIIGVVSMMITSRVQLTEMNRTINEYDDTMKKLKSEETRLQTELAQKLSAQSVDEYARSQGMTGIESEQIHYIGGMRCLTPSPAGSLRAEKICPSRHTAGTRAISM